MDLSSEKQLGYALQAFAFAYKKDKEWVKRNLLYFREVGISSMYDLEVRCKDQTINLDLELFGVPPEDRLDSETIDHLRSFLPGPMGFRCFRLAQMCAEKVKKGNADTNYVHRPESGKLGDEKFPTDLATDRDWILHVDCAGFVRNCLKHVTKDPFVMLLSDRDFMRAKDFFGFFSTIPYTVMDPEEINESDKRMKWRIVPDLRMTIPGDVIVYRPRGNAAGGAAFTENDRTDLYHLLRAVKTARLWHQKAAAEGDMLGTRNFAKDPTVTKWSQEIKSQLHDIGIKNIHQLRVKFPSINQLLLKYGYAPLEDEYLRLMQECAETTAMNTGHIIFAAGPAVDMGDNEYRIRVVHSTKFGYRDEEGKRTQGVQEYYRRFKLIEGPDGQVRFTREMKKPKNGIIKTTSSINVTPPPTPVVDSNSTSSSSNNTTSTEDVTIVESEENAYDDMEDANHEEDPTQNDDEAEDAPQDDLHGSLEIEVLSARMCF